MGQNLLIEDNPSPKFDEVRLDYDIINVINTICEYNSDNTEGVSEFKDYIDHVKDYISNWSIAFDYANDKRFIRHMRNGAVRSSFYRNFCVWFVIQLNRAKTHAHIYVFKAEINLSYFGLKVPPTIPKSKHVSFINEGKLHSIIHETANRDMHIMALETLIDRITRQVISEMRRRQHRKRNKHKSRSKALQKIHLMRKKSRALSNRLQNFIDDLSSIPREGH